MADQLPLSPDEIIDGVVRLHRAGGTPEQIAEVMAPSLSLEQVREIIAAANKPPASTEFGDMLDAIAKEIMAAMEEPGSIVSIVVVSHGTAEVVEGEIEIEPDETGNQPVVRVRVMKAPD